MDRPTAGRSKRQPHIVRYLLSGILAIVPLWLTWIIFDFILGQLAKIGMPGLQLTARRLATDYPDIAEWILQPWIDDVLAAMITLFGLYLLGWFVNQVVGRRLFAMFEGFVRRLPRAEMASAEGLRPVVMLAQGQPTAPRRSTVATQSELGGVPSSAQARPWSRRAGRGRGSCGLTSRSGWQSLCSA